METLVLSKGEWEGDHRTALLSIDLLEDYLAGFSIQSIKPKPKSKTLVPFSKDKSFTFHASLPAGASRTFVFTMQAKKAGTFKGEMNIYEGMRSVTDVLQTTVTEKR